MNSQPLVSVIVPTFNRPQYLRDTLQSIVEQSYANIEVLVVDDGSDEEYASDICKQFSNCTYFKKENGGVSSARNYGIEKAKGDFIAFLDDDDLWKPHKIEQQLNILKIHSDVDLVHSSAEVIDQYGILTGEIIGASKGKEHKRTGYVFWKAYCNWLVKSPTPLIRRGVFKRGLRFDERIKSGEDMDFYNRLFFYHKIYCHSDSLAYYRVYQDNSRLSLNNENYKEARVLMYDNFRTIKIGNPIIRYRLAHLFLKRIVKKVYFSEYKLSFLDMFVFPIKKMNQIVLDAKRSKP
ncbi:glycosyltransferase [Urechidicola sp. KH5]